MPDTAPAAPAVLNRDLPPGPRLVLVANPGDDHRMVRRLAAVEGPGRLVVRPTPGGRVSDLALDILTATGRSPSALLADRIPTSDAWAQAAAQLTADQTRHLVVDRAHRLPGDALELLADLGRRAGATVWLIWPTTEDDKHVPAPLRAFRDAGYRLDAIDFRAFMRELPPPPRVLTGGLRADAETPWAEGTGPALPMQDFPVFLAHCREKLPGNTFTAVRAVYDREVHLADQWLTRRGLTGHHTHPGSPRHTRTFAARLTFHLRDHRIGPAPDQAHALARLRGIQTALFFRGYLLRWQYETLGAGPTTRLLSQLTARACDKLRAAATIEDAAATALSIHLSHGPTGLGLITCGNTAPDGHAIHLPVTGSPYISEETRFLTVPWKWRSHRHRPIELSALDVLHLESDDPVLLPEHAAPLVAAHLAYRRQQGATDSDPLFVHPDSPGVKSPEPGLREAVLRTCHRIHLNPAWLHRSHCRHGDEDQRDAQQAGWMHHRGLDLIPLSDHVRSRL
ncbi:ATP-binding protein [Streptomyces cinereoruber]|uniref:ATP-binding protein n=1 Tax=Streptomyces cinereoruber TaxID=67260 RepID=UPI00363E48A3